MKRRGETLLELTAAIGLLTLVLFALLTVVPGSFFTMPKAEHQMAANARAEEILNGLAAGPFTALTPMTDLLRLVTVRIEWQDRQKHQLLVRHRRLSRIQR